MAENRLSRELENRENVARKKAWVPPQTLPTPDEKDGWVFRWIRTSMLGQLDPTNTSAKFREGWEPVKAEDHPELMHQADPGSRYKGNVEVGGLLLCKAPSDLMKQRDDYYRQQTRSQIESVDNSFLRTEDKRMPLFNERRSTTSFGKGK